MDPSGDTWTAGLGDARQPDLEHGSRPGQCSRRRAEEAHLAVRGAEKGAQNLTAGLFARAAPYRQRERGRFHQHGDGPTFDGDQGHLAVAPRELGQGAALELAQQRGRAVHLAHEQGARAVLILKRPRQEVEARSAPGELSKLEFLERLRPLTAADRHDVVHDVVASPREPPSPGMPHASLGFELDAGQEQGRVDERAHAARRVRRAREGLLAFELGDVGFERLRQHQRDAALPPTDRAQREDATVVDPDAEPTAHAAAAERPVGRVEVDVALEERLHRAGAEAQRERVQHHTVQDLQRRDLAPPLRRHT